MSSNVFAANVYYAGNVIVSQTLNVGAITSTAAATFSATPAAAANVLTVIGSSTTGNVFQFSNTAGGNFIMTNAGNVGIGTTTPTQTLTVGTGGTVNFSNALYTQMNTVTGASAATITAGFNTGTGPTPNTPTAGEYQWTIGGATTFGNIVSLGLYPPGATFRWTFTARSTSTSVNFNFQTVANSVYAFNSPTLTSSYQTFTWTATIPSNGDRTCYFGVNGTASGQNIIWNSFTATRLDTIVTGNIGIGTTSPASTLSVNGSVILGAAYYAGNFNSKTGPYILQASGFDAVGTTHTIAFSSWQGSVNGDNLGGIMIIIGKNLSASGKVGCMTLSVSKRAGAFTFTQTINNNTVGLSTFSVSISNNDIIITSDSDMAVTWTFIAGV